MARLHSTLLLASVMAFPLFSFGMVFAQDAPPSAQTSSTDESATASNDAVDTDGSDAAKTPPDSPPASVVELLEESKQKLEEQFSNKSREQLYKEFFNISPPKIASQIEAKLVINETTDGMIEVVFSEDRTDFSIPAPPALEILKTMLKPEIYKQISSLVDSSGRLLKSEVEKYELQISFDAGTYEVYIAVPSHLRSKQVHRLIGVREDPWVVPSVKPSIVSAYINLHGTQRLQYNQRLNNDTLTILDRPYEAANKKFRKPASCAFDGALNVFNVVAEGSAVVQEKANSQSTDPFVRRNAARIGYDFPKSALRLSAGDIMYPSTKYQSYIRMGGIGITKDFALQPYLLTYPVSETEFLLEEAAEIEVWVNETMTRRMYLEAGTHSIEGLPFVAGNNDVRIVAKDFSGRRDITSFSFLHVPKLLARGKTQYSGNIGFPSFLDKGRYRYDFDHPLGLLAYRRGVADFMTIGGYIQSMGGDKNLFGLEGKYATNLGILDFEVAGSLISDSGADFGGRLGYTLESRALSRHYESSQDGAKRRIPPVVWRTDIEYLGGNFIKRLADTALFYDEKMKFSSAVSIPTADWFTLQLGAKYTMHHIDTFSNVFDYSLRIQNMLMKSLRTRAMLQFTSDIKGHTHPAVSVAVYWSFRSKSNSFSVSERVSRHDPSRSTVLADSTATHRKWDFNHSLMWDYFDPIPRPEKVTASILAMVGPQNGNYTGRIGLEGNQGVVDLSHYIDDPVVDNAMGQSRYLSHQTSLQAKTALVYAGSAVSLSRPVRGGFVVVKSGKNLRKNKILVNPAGEGYEAVNNRLFPAVLPLYSSYQLKKIKLEPVDPPVGSINEKTEYTLLPRYKSGFVLTMGSSQTVLVTGTLYYANRSPFAYQSITIEFIKDKLPPIATFTNGAGRFQFVAKEGALCELLPPETSVSSSFTIDIPKKLSGYYDVGDLFFGAGGASDDSESDNNTDTTQDEQKTKVIVKDAEGRTFILQSEDALQGSETVIDGILVTGQLVDQFGRPLAKQAVVVSWQNEGKGERGEIMTEQNGGFHIMCTNPGTYTVTPTNSDRFGATSFEIPEGAKGTVPIGKLEVEAK